MDEHTSDNYLQTIAAIEVATWLDELPSVVITTTIQGQRVSVLDIPVPQPDGRHTRAGWIAVAGEYDLWPAQIVDGTPVAGGVIGGELLATSRRSARSALATARAALTARARTARLQGK